MRTLLLALALVALAMGGCTRANPEDGAVSNVEIVASPGPARPGEEFEVCWHVEGVGTTTHTDLHVSNESQPREPAGPDPHGGESIFPDNANAADPAGYAVPGRYCAMVTMPAEGSLFLVAHAKDDSNDRHRLSEETRVSRDPPTS